MDTGKITCPDCGHTFALSDAITGQIREDLRAGLLKETARREETTRKKLEKQFSEQIHELHGELKERDDRIKTIRQTEKKLLEKEREIREMRRFMELEVARKVDTERDGIRKETKRQVESRHRAKIEEMRGVLEEKEKTLDDFRQRELELRKQQRTLEDEKKSFELEVARKLDEEREQIRQKTVEEAAEANRLKNLEKDKMINDLKAALDDMKRKAEQGSMETQGEALELDFEHQLNSFFPQDDIRPVPKGIRGADLVQGVRTPFGAACGTLLWETKNTKAWSGQWIPKLKDDMIEIRAEMAILVSVALPGEISRFGRMDGVWVSDPYCAMALAAALREQLIAVSQERELSVGKNEKMEILYQYLAGVEFKQKIEGIVEAFTAMQDQLNKERRAMERHWNQREKQIHRVIKNTVGLYGDMQGIIGGQIPEIPALELEEK